MALEKESLNNFLPNGFETLNQEGYKENFTEDKIQTGYEKDVPDIVSGPNLNNLIDVVGKNTNILSKFMDFIKNMPVNNTLKVNSANQLDYEDVSDLNNKVSKTGDTMTGNLTIAPDSNRGMLFLKNKNLDYETVKTDSNSQFGILQFLDKNDNYVSYIQSEDYANENLRTLRLSIRRKVNNIDKYAQIQLRIDESGNDYVYLSNGIKSNFANLAMPSSSVTNLSVGVSGSNLTAPNNGYYCISATSTSNTGFVYLDGTIRNQCSAGVGGENIHTFIPVIKGQQISYAYNYVNNISLQFFKCMGEI